MAMGKTALNLARLDTDGPIAAEARKCPMDGNGEEGVG